jgi:hypothetical protein
MISCSRWSGLWNLNRNIRYICGEKGKFIAAKAGTHRGEIIDVGDSKRYQGFRELMRKHLRTI